MSNPDSSAPRAAESWDTYWHGAGDAGAYSSGGVSHPAIRAFWEHFFQRVKQEYATPKFLDVASGSGAVVERVLAEFGDEQPDITCVDVSEAAIANIRERFPGVHGLVADARAIPLEAGGFDVVTSQFGVEYAGTEAIGEAARLVAPGGRLALLLHSAESAIHLECEASLDAIRRLQESRFIPLSIRMLAAGFAACRGADRTPYEEAAARLAPAIAELDAIMAEHGEHVAGDSIARLYGDVDRIHRGMQRYEPAEVLEWLDRMDGELEAYAGRMSSMGDAALTAERFDAVCAELGDRGFVLPRAESFGAPGQDRPLAWVLVAEHESAHEDRRRDARAWVKQQLDAAVWELIDKGAFEDLVLEAKPAWAHPFDVLIGRIRGQGGSGEFSWVICGDVPTDHVDSAAASTPREAARYFAMKWQLDARRDEGGVADDLTDKAEALYALVDDATVWQHDGGL